MKRGGGMFAVMEWTKPKRRGFFARQAVKKRGAYPIIEKKSVGGATYYALLTEKTGKLNLPYLRRAAGDLCRGMVLPRDVNLPANCGITAFDDSGYIMILLLNSVRYILENSAVPPGRIRLGLYDPTGRCAAAAVTFLKYAESVRVASPREDVYSRYSLIALDNYGAQFIYGTPGDSADLFEGCAIVVAPFGTAGMHVHRETFIFSGNPADGEFSVDRSRVRLPSPYSENVPAGVCPVTFAAALRDSYPIPALNALIPEYLSRRGEVVPIKMLSGKYLGLTIGS